MQPTWLPFSIAPSYMVTLTNSHYQFEKTSVYTGVEWETTFFEILCDLNQGVSNHFADEAGPVAYPANEFGSRLRGD